MALNGLEHRLRQKYPQANTRSRAAKVNVIVFADDFIITGSSQELLENEVKPLVVEFLQERGLRLSETKTRITHIKDGFDFLGLQVRQLSGKILTQPSRSNTNRFLQKVREIIRQNPQAKTENLILQLNPVIWGWANYHRHGASKQSGPRNFLSPLAMG
jgi:RNA-directed DNA polymerase